MGRVPRLPARLLVDLPNWIGDQVMALPAVARLVDGNRGATTVLNCRPPVRRLLAELFPEALVVATPRRASPLRTAVHLCHVRGRFDVGVTLRNASRAKLLLWLAARTAVGSSGDGAGLLLLTHTFAVDRNRHQLFDSDPLLKALGLPGADPEWRPVLPARLLEEGRVELGAAAVAGLPRLVGVAPGAAWGSSKRWPSARFGELAARLRGCGWRPLVVIGPGEEELAREVVVAADGPLPVVGAGVDVAGLAGVLAELELLVGNDSGPLHLAAMLGVPVVGLYGPTDPLRTAPLGKRQLVISRGLTCAPCLQPRCPLGHGNCLASLDVDEVVAAALRQVGATP